MISFTVTGSFAKTDAWLKRLKSGDILTVLKAKGAEGVKALSAATPIDSGLAAGSWGFTVSGGRGIYTITWTNHDVESGFPVAIMLQYGYATGTGGFVQGEDYINPAMRPVFDKIANEVWKAVTSL